MSRAPAPTVQLLSDRNLVALTGVITAAVFAAYANTFTVPFIFDDHLAIIANPTLRDLSRLDLVLFLPGAEANTVGGRPIVNLTLALNYAISGIAPWSYHVGNLIIHIAAALTLWGILRRTFVRPPLRDAIAGDEQTLAFFIALLWALHPMATQCVTYVVQRAESLAGLFYLLTLYGFIRAADSPRPRRWYLASFAACLTGVATKEVVVSAPIFVLLYDRALLSTSWRAVWEQRRCYYAALASTWVLLLVLVLGTEGRGGSAGFGAGVIWWEYLFTQSHALLTYLRLALWPHPLIFDYGTSIYRDLATVAPRAAVCVVLLGATVWAVFRRPMWALPGAWFFLILAPSSSIVPVVTQTISEHRMYLPLIAIVAMIAFGLHRLLGQRAGLVLSLLAVAAAATTFSRNHTYATELSIWTDTVAKRPQNFRAHTTVGTLLLEAGRIPEAITHFETSLALNPENAASHLNFSNALLQANRPAEAARQAEIAVRLAPQNPHAHNNLGNALLALGQTESAIRHYQLALEHEPDAADVRVNLAGALVKSGSFAAATDHYRAALQLQPERAAIWSALAQALLEQGETVSARRAAERALQLDPRTADASYLLGNLDAASNELASAISRYREALATAPEYRAARNNLANALLLHGEVDEAILHYQQILREQPNESSVQENLAQALELQRLRRSGR